MKKPSLLLHSRLSFMMFLHFFSLGAITPVFSLYLIETLRFSGTQAGTILAVGSLAMVLSPLISAYIADRLVSGPALLAGLNLAAALLFYLMEGTTDFWWVLGLYALAMAAKGPTFALSNSITFHHLEDREKHFPRIRLWGTIGWIAAGWTFSLFMLRTDGSHSLGLVLIFAALASFLLGIYGLTLPRIPKVLTGVPPQPPVLEKKKTRLEKEIVVFLLVTVLISAADKFYFFGASLWLSQLGWANDTILPLMTVGQITEVGAMLFLSYLLPRLGFRRIFLVGIALQVLRFALLAVVQAPWEVVVGISLHGLCFSFFFANAFVYIDSRTTETNRSKVHQLYIFLVEGVGVSLGNLGAGLAAQNLVLPSGGPNFQWFWPLPGLLALLSFFALLFFFKPRKILAP